MAIRSEFETGKDQARAALGVAPTMTVEGHQVIIPDIFRFEAEKLFSGQIGIPREQIIASIASSTWAQRWAQGILNMALGPQGLAVLPEATRQARVTELARRLAERVAPAEIAPPVQPPAATAPVVRRRAAAT